jgi:hypothetical protein
MRTLKSDFEIIYAFRYAGSFSSGTCLILKIFSKLKGYSSSESSALLEEYRQISRANIDSLGFEDYPDWENLSRQTQEEIREIKIVEFLRYVQRKLSLNCS